MKPKRPILYLRRKFDAFLQSWRAREDRLPLILKGARQVGKTEAVRHFAETAYAEFVEINFVERPEFKEIVRDGFSVDSLVRAISENGSFVKHKGKIPAKFAKKPAIWRKWKAVCVGVQVWIRRAMWNQTLLGK